MRGTEDLYASSHVLLSKIAIPLLLIMLTYVTEVTPLVNCREDSSHLTIDCVYIKAEGILCTWDWKNFTDVDITERHNITATVVLNNSIGIPSQICANQGRNTTCRFDNHFDASTMFYVSALTNYSTAEEIYETCKTLSLLTTVRYEKPRNVILYHSWWGPWTTDVVWQFPSDYPTSQGVMKTWSACKVRWSVNEGPWEERQVRSNSFMSIVDLPPLSTYNVQVTCYCVYSRRENWTSNKTFTTPDPGGIVHDPVPDVTTTQIAVTQLRTVSVIIQRSTQTSERTSKDTSHQSTMRSSTRNQEQSLLSTPIRRSGAQLALGVVGAVILLLLVVLSGLIFIHRYRKTPKQKSLPREEEDSNWQSADISRWVSKEQLLNITSHEKHNKKQKESVL